MNLIPLALIWEMLSRGRWYLLAALLGANAVPLTMLALLRSSGVLEAENEGLIGMHTMLTQLHMFLFGAAVFAAMGRLRRLFAWPVSNSALVAWHLFPAMALLLIESAASFALINVVFDLGWPVWGPALSGAVLLAAVGVVLWLMPHTAWLIVGLTVVSGLAGLWFKTRYGDLTGISTHYWRQITAGEAATLLAATAAIYGAGVAAVRLNRRGDPPWTLGILAAIQRLVDAVPSVGQTLRGPAAAQLSFEWRRKGWALPGAIVVLLLLGLTIWLLSIREPSELYGGVLGLGMLLPWLGLVAGLVIGKTGHDELQFTMGQFMATRPMSSPDIARALLKTAAGSVLLAWCIWAGAVVIVGGLLAAAGVSPRPAIKGLSWWYVPGSLLGTWIVTAAFASICMTGRMGRFLPWICGLSATVIGLAIYAEWMLSPTQQEILWRCLLGCVIAACVLGTSWGMLTAWRRGLIGATTVHASMAAWVAMCAGIMGAYAMHPEHPLLPYVFLSGLASLVVAPFATMPLAVAWNRNR